jgi:hypothetical protein
MNKLKELNRVHGNENGTINEYRKMYSVNFDAMSDKAFKNFIRSIDVDSMDLDDLSEVA